MYDWETRVVDGAHVPYSYSIIFVNIFDLSKSEIVLKYNWDPKTLLKEFVLDVKEIATTNYNLQNVDHPTIPDNAKIPEFCPFCLEPTSGKADYWHSHFEGDNLNKGLDGYGCHSCNQKACIKSKPLKFYGHNASKFDQNIFMEELINDPTLKNFEFLAKTESRFTQVTCSLLEDPRNIILSPRKK